MKRTFLVGISAVALSMGASGSARAFTEIKTAFVPEDPLEQHRIVAKSCKQPRGFRRIEMKGGTRFAREGEVFAFQPRVIRAERCEEIEIVLENTDPVRHALMLPGLSPMFMLEFTGHGVQSARFVTPDEDVTLDFHCHVPSHEQMGMFGRLIVGKGGVKAALETEQAAAGRLYEGLGVVVRVDLRASRLVVDHEEIEDFMAAMEMSYQVAPPALLAGLGKGDRIRFAIDPDKRAIVEIEGLGKAAD